MLYNKFFPYLLILAAVLSAFEIELSLPSLPDIARAFSVSEEAAAATISLNFLGFFISSLFYGPLSDRFGRRPILLLGAVLFLIGSVGCVLAPIIELVWVSRFVQGVGAAGSFVIAITMLSDVYKDNEATHWIGMLNAIETIVIASSPILGSYLNASFGWNACYTTIALVTCIQLVLLYLYLPETRQGKPCKIRTTFQDYAELLSSGQFIQSSLVPTLFACGYMAFISTIPFLYRNELEVSLSEFGWHQFAILASFSIMSYFANRVSTYFGEAKTTWICTLIPCVIAFTLLYLSYISEIPQVIVITGLMCLASIACAIPIAILFSTSLSVIPGKNGPASSLSMSIRPLLTACAIQLAGYLYDSTLLPSAAILASCNFLAFLLASLFYKNALTSTFFKSLYFDKHH